MTGHQIFADWTTPLAREFSHLKQSSGGSF